MRLRECPFRERLVIPFATSARRFPKEEHSVRASSTPRMSYELPFGQLIRPRPEVCEESKPLLVLFARIGKTGPLRLVKWRGA